MALHRKLVRNLAEFFYCILSAYHNKQSFPHLPRGSALLISRLATKYYHNTVQLFCQFFLTTSFSSRQVALICKILIIKTIGTTTNTEQKECGEFEKEIILCALFYYKKLFLNTKISDFFVLFFKFHHISKRHITSACSSNSIPTRLNIWDSFMVLSENTDIGN